jgi:hypothetical protein
MWRRPPSAVPRKSRHAPIDKPVGGPKTRRLPLRSGDRMQPNSVSWGWRMADNEQAREGRKKPTHASAEMLCES